MNTHPILRTIVRAAALAAFIPASTYAAAVTTSVGGNASVASVSGVRDTFRNIIGGGTVVGSNGSFGTARREINWDGVLPASSAPNLLAANFFNARGVLFGGPATGFEVSGAAADTGTAGQPAAANFGNINAGYTATFGVFSGERLFTSIGSNITDVTFFIPGTNTPSFINAFGAIFTDVDTAGSTSLQFFDLSNASLGVFPVPVGTVASKSLSFLGVSFNAGERVGRVRITSGNAALGAAVNDGGATDLVVMDDFIYSEPVPEPGTLSLAGLALFGMCARSRRRAGRSE